MKKLTAVLFATLFSIPMLAASASAMCPDGEDKPGITSNQDSPLACPGGDEKPQT